MNILNRTLLLTALASVGVAGSAGAATIIDPILGTEIDPAAAQDVDQSFGTAQATLEARSDLRVLQSFAGFTTGSNDVSFTDATLPDIQFAFTGASGSSGSESTNNQYGTSSGSNMNLRNSDTGAAPYTPNSSTLTITFSSPVAAAGFTLANIYSAKNVTATFRDSGGSAITGATFNFNGVGSDPNGDTPRGTPDFYVGWDSDAETTSQIGSITVTFDDTAQEFTSGFDDLAFTLVPEPGSLALLGLGGLCLISRRRRA